MASVASLFLIGFSVAWYSVFAHKLLTLPNASRLQRLLGCVFCWWAISTFKDILFYLPTGDVAALLDNIFYIDGFGAITFALILLELTIPGWITRKRVVAMFSPFVVFFLLHIVIDPSFFHILYTVFFVSFAWTAVIIAIMKGMKYTMAIRQHYADIEDVDISWVWGIVAAFIICQHVWWAVSDSLNQIADTLYYASSLLCWYFTMRGINRLRPLRLPDDDLTETITDNSDKLKKYSANLSGRLEDIMEKEKLYLNPDITIPELAMHLATNRTYLSNYISTELNTTFYDYINRMRIEREVLPMMQSEENLSLDYIAKTAGFKSISTFRRNFKKIVGMLPSEYLLRINRKKQ